MPSRLSTILPALTDEIRLVVGDRVQRRRYVHTTTVDPDGNDCQSPGMAESKEPKWSQRETELDRLERTLAAFSKASEFGKYMRPAFPMPTGLPQSLGFQAPAWESLVNSQRIFNRLEQIERLAQSFPTEAELEARYEERKEATLSLAKRGWFIPLEMTLGEHKTLFNKMATNQEEELEGLIENHLEASLSEIEAQLVEEFPERTAILNEAFELHRKGKYFGSVALFLSLSDGIGHGIFKAFPLVSSEKKLEKIQKTIEPYRSKDFLIGWCWDAIGRVLPINDWTGNLHNYDDPLNWHAVLHGLASDYGTKRNSLKALSWLNHVAQFRDMLVARAATAVRPLLTLSQNSSKANSPYTRGTFLKF